MIENKKVLNVYDFDGTVTRKDSLLEFLRYCFGLPRLAMAFLRYSPLLILMKLGLVDNGRVKERIFSHFFKGMPIGKFDEICASFAQTNKSILRAGAMASINANLSSGERVVILSASIKNWVQPFFRGMDVKVLGTALDSRNGILTGRFKGRNCYGAEKVRCLHQVYPAQSYDILRVYGDSRGDWELLQIADQSFYKIFK